MRLSLEEAQILRKIARECGQRSHFIYKLTIEYNCGWDRVKVNGTTFSLRHPEANQ